MRKSFQYADFILILSSLVYVVIESKCYVNSLQYPNQTLLLLIYIGDFVIVIFLFVEHLEINVRNLDYYHYLLNFIELKNNLIIKTFNIIKLIL